MAFCELRQHTVTPGEMAQWLEVMETDIIPFQVSKGMVVQRIVPTERSVLR